MTKGGVEGLGHDTQAESVLAEVDVRALVRVIADCAVIPGGIMAQKRQLMGSLARMLDSDLWMWNVSRITDDGEIIGVSLLHNLSESQLAFLVDYHYTTPEDPVNQAMVELSREHGRWSRRLEDMLDVKALGERIHTSWPELGIDQSLFVFFPVPDSQGMTSCIGLHRADGAAPFTERELRIAHIVLSEVSWLHEACVPEEDGHAVTALSPRLQTVLTLLVDGQSAKRIAFHLKLSPHTVRGYIKDIYRHFDVGSRSELMHRFMVGDGRDRPM